MYCKCGDSEYDHYRRAFPNGQKFDDVCVNCLIAVVTGAKNIEPWHKMEIVE